MAQSDMDGGSGGWKSFFNQTLSNAGATLANQITGTTGSAAATSSSAERTADKTLTEDIQGAPTQTQTSQVGGINVDGRTLMIGGGVLVTAVALFLIAGR